MLAKDINKILVYFNFIPFEIERAAECNAISLKVYKNIYAKG